MIPIPKPQKPLIPQRISLSGWLQGYISSDDDDRIPNDGLKTCSNMVINQNGTLRPRPSLVPYGTQPVGTVLGQIYPFVKVVSNVPQNWLASVQVVSGVAQVYVAKDGGTWQLCTGKTYNTSAPVHFEQVNNSVLITNGVDNLSYLNVTSLTVVPFTSLTTPTGVSVSQTGLTGTNYTYRYRVSACNQGETAASAAQTVSVSTLREAWTSGEYTTVTWNRVTGAQQYNIYLGDEAGFEYYLDSVADLGSGSTQTFTDNGSVTQNTNRLAPEGDSTAGPRTTRCTNVLGQVFMVGDTDNPWRLWFGGNTGSNALDFSAFDGGGYVDIDLGGRDFPAKVVGFRDGKGDPVATVVEKGLSGRGKLVHASMATTTIGDTVITYAQLQEANGQDGTNAPDAVLYAQDALWFPSVDGFKTTGTKAAIQNILSTSLFSQQIIPDVSNLNVAQMGSAVGAVFQNRLYFAVPVGNTVNNQVWVCDLNRNGLWTNPWYMNATWLTPYDDNEGNTWFLVLSNNGIYQLSYSQTTQDGMTPFATAAESGLIKFSPDGLDWGSVVDATFILERPQGIINVSISGFTQDGTNQLVNSGTFTPPSSVTGWNEYAWNATYWNNVLDVPITYGNARVQLTVPVDEDMNWLQWSLSTSNQSVDFELSEVILRYVPIGVIDIT